MCGGGGKYILCGEGGMVHRYCVCGGGNIYCVEREEWYIGTVWGGGVNIYCVEREEWYIGTVCRGRVNIYCVEREG